MDREAFWRSIADWVGGVAEASLRRPVLVGLSAPQGAGKTTLTAEVCRMLGERGLRAVAISIDDFYLRRSEQAALAAADPGNGYLQVRGLPGTHDIALGTATLTTLKELSGAGRVAAPAYDRSAFAGKGDRAVEPRMVEGPLDVVLVEGWMLGFTPVDPADLPDEHFRAVNRTLVEYAAWHALLDAFIWLEPVDFTYVRTWRAEAEEKMRAAGKPGMTPEEVAAFVRPYLACYPVYYPALRQGSPVKGPYLHYVIGRDRLPVA